MQEKAVGGDFPVQFVTENGIVQSVFVGAVDAQLVGSAGLGIKVYSGARGYGGAGVREMFRALSTILVPPYPRTPVPTKNSGGGLTVLVVNYLARAVVKVGT